MPQNEYDIGLNWWNAQDGSASDQSNYWQDFFTSSDLLSDFSEDYQAPYWPDGFNEGYNPISFLLGSPNLTQSLSGFNINPLEPYRAEEAGNIQRGLYQNEYRDKIKPLEDRKFRAAGFASSGSGSRSNDLYNNYRDKMDEIDRGVDTSLDDIYSSFGGQLVGVIDDYTNQEGGPFTHTDEYFMDFYNDYVQNWTGYDAFVADYEANPPSGGGYYNARAIDAYTQDIESCIEDEMGMNPGSYLSALNTCRESKQTLG